MAEAAELFPVFLRLNGRAVLVVGAGPVAATKIQSLLDAGAKVTVVAPEVHPDIEAANVTILRRRFLPSDLDGAWFVIAAADGDVNRAVAIEAETRHLFVNAVDDPASASAYLGGVVRRDGVTVAISTSGAAPALAGLLREGLDSVLPHELGKWSETARSLRPQWRSDRVPVQARRPMLLEALNALYQERGGRG